MNENAFIAALRSLAGTAAARDLLDDVAVLNFGGRRLVLTHDMIVEAVHFLSDDDPADVAWKLVAVNLSDLAAKGAQPIGALLGYTLSDDCWNAAFVSGLAAVLETFELPLLGGDTVSAPPGAPRSLGLTAIGEANLAVPARSGAASGDILWVSGSIGDAGAGLRIALGQCTGPANLVERYRRPWPRLLLGAQLAPIVSAMMDVSDGLLIDASRMAGASRLGWEIELRDIPLSRPLVDMLGDERQTRIDAAIAGDDYELLFAAPPGRSGDIRRIEQELALPLTAIGRFTAGSELRLLEGGRAMPLPARLGYEHDGASQQG